MLARDASTGNSTESILLKQLKIAKNIVKENHNVPLWRSTKRKENVPCVKGRTNPPLAASMMLRSSLKVPVEKFLSIIPPNSLYNLRKIHQRKVFD